MPKRRILIQMEDEMYDAVLAKVFIMRIRGDRRASIASFVRLACETALEERREGRKVGKVTKGKVGKV